MPTCGYGFYLLVSNSISHSFALLDNNGLYWTVTDVSCQAILELQTSSLTLLDSRHTIPPVKCCWLDGRLQAVRGKTYRQRQKKNTEKLTKLSLLAKLHSSNLMNTTRL